MGEPGNPLSAEGGSVRFVAARNIRFGHRPRDSRLRGNDVMGDWNDVAGGGTRRDGRVGGNLAASTDHSVNAPSDLAGLGCAHEYASGRRP